MTGRGLCRMAALWMVSLPLSTRAADAPLVRIECSTEGRIFKWQVKNVNAPPITRFEVPVYSIFLHKAPEGWTFASATESSFVASAASQAYAIHAGQSGLFSARAMSSGAVLASGKAVVSFSTGNSMTIEDVWVPEIERFSTRMIPPAVIVGIAVLLLLLARSRRRKRRSARAD